MRIATWNLQRPGGPASQRARALRRAMLQIDADIWILTETHELVAPGDGYAAAATEGSDRVQRPGERWTMIWSRLPVMGREPTADPVRTICVRVDAGRRGSLLVYGNVLPWRADVSRLPLKGGEAFKQALLVQAEDWRNLRHQYPDDGLCIAGDFNQDLGPRLYAGTAVGRESLRSVLSELSLTCLTGDEHDPVAQQTAGLRRNIDHICLDARFNTAGVRCGAWPATVAELNGLSDHFGVWVDVDLSRICGISD